MTLEQVLFAVIAWLTITGIIYTHSGWQNIRDCYSMWFTRAYWTDYNM